MGYEFLLLVIVSCLVPVFIFLIIKYMFNNDEIFKKSLICFEVVLTAVLVTLLLFERFLKVSFIVGLVLEFIVMMLCEITILKNDMKSGVISAFCAEVILVMFKVFINFSFVNKLKLKVSVAWMNIISKKDIVILALVVCMIILYRQLNKIVKDMLAKNKENYFKGVHIFITGAVITANLICYNLAFEQKVEVMFVLNFTITVVYCVFCLITVNMFNKYEKGMEELEYQCYYNRTLNYLMKDLRRFKHDYNNMLAVFGGFLQLQKYDELNKYYEFIAKNIKYSSIEANKSMTNIKNAGILGLLLYKLNLAKGKGVKFIIEVRTEIGRFDIKINEFCEILGILLDNAIEAASETKEKVVKLEVYQKSDCSVFTVKNSVMKKIDVKKIYERGYSTKGKNRGIGLAVVYELVEKSGNMYLDSECSDNEFKQKLIFSCRNLVSKKW